jgi:hypothetical protein
MTKLFPVLFLLCGWSFPALAQSTIIDSLEENLPGQGVIRVHAPAAVNRLIGRKSESPANGNVEYAKAAGYRVQVFAGNQQGSSKSEVFDRQKSINETFPDLSVYVIYNAPYWRLRVGDCTSYEEAYFLMKQISKRLSDLKKEMYVVKDEIKVLANAGTVHPE